jgi:hypothetical protein
MVREIAFRSGILEIRIHGALGFNNILPGWGNDSATAASLGEDIVVVGDYARSSTTPLSRM